MNKNRNYEKTNKLPNQKEIYKIQNAEIKLSLDFFNENPPFKLDFEKKENKKIRPLSKKNNLLKFLLIFILIFFLVIILPFLINLSFHIPVNTSYFESLFSPGELLTYEGTIIGAIILFATVYFTIKNNHKAQVLSILDKRIEDFLNLLSIDTLKESGNERTTKEKIDYYFELYREMAKQYYELCLYMPRKLQKYFECRFLGHLADIEIKLLEIQRVYLLFTGNKITDDDYVTIYSKVREYEIKNTSELLDYLEKTCETARQTLYEIRHTLSGI